MLALDAHFLYSPAFRTMTSPSEYAEGYFGHSRWHAAQANSKGDDRSGIPMRILLPSLQLWWEGCGGGGSPALLST
jgi:hypothetical protein